MTPGFQIMKNARHVSRAEGSFPLRSEYFSGLLSPGPKPPLPCRCAMQALLTDLVADSVFLLVQRALLLARDMAAVLVGHHALFPANLMIFLV